MPFQNQAGSPPDNFESNPTQAEVVWSSDQIKLSLCFFNREIGIGSGEPLLTNCVNSVVKKILALLFSLFLHAQAADVNIGWNPNRQSELITEYSVVYGKESGNLKESKTVNGSINASKITDLEDGCKYFFAVKAKNASGESPLSDEISYLTPKKARFLDKSTWTLAVSSEESSLGKNEKEKALDGDSSTFWHSKWLDGTLPQSFSVNLGKTAKVEGIAYLPRQDDFLVGVIRLYELSASKDGVVWEIVSSGEFSNNKSEKILSFAPRGVKFIKLTAKSDWKNGESGRAAIAEFKVIGEYVPELQIPSKPTGLKVNQ